jgi:DNA repair photolyase
MVVKEIECKSILNKSGIPGIDYGVNPYVGCAHKCQYCYAVFMKRFTKHTEPWGDFVDVKVNAPEILERQLKKLTQKSHVSFGTVCDAYQPLEVKYRITRKCLEKLKIYYHEVSILTKSDLVLRDLDLLKKIKNIKVGFTITSLESKIKTIFEPRSSPPQKRLKVLKTLSENKIPTWVFVAPTLPYFSDSEKMLRQIFESSQNAGAQYILFDTLNPYPKVWNNITKLIKKHFPKAIDHYNQYYDDITKHEKQLKKKIQRIARKYKIKHDFAF